MARFLILFMLLASLGAAQSPDATPPLSIPDGAIGTSYTITVNGVTTITTPLLSAWQDNVTSNARLLYQLAAMQHDRTSIQVLRQRGADINARDWKAGMTALHEVVMAQDREAARLLLEEGANPNYTGATGTSPLYDAVALNLYSMIDLLLEHKADPNQPELLMGFYPLHTAAVDGDTTSTLQLINQGARVDVTNPKGITPLHLAVNSRNPRLVRLLLQHGADPQAKSDAGVTPLSFAETNGLEPIRQLLSDPTLAPPATAEN